jgi:hypothetical protein
MSSLKSRRLLLVALVITGCGGGGSDPAPGADAGNETADAAPADLPAASAPDLARADAGAEAPPAAADAAIADAPALDQASGDVAADLAAIAADAGDAPAAETGPDARPDSTAPDATPVDPICATADSRGFFGSCSACVRQDDCDGISVGGRTRYACGCSTAACPCGFRCGCADIAPGVRVCNVCVR